MHVSTYIGGLDGFHEFTIAVVNHHHQVGLNVLAEGNQLTDLGNREGGAGGITLGTLNGDHFGSGVDGLGNAVIVKGTVGKQIHLIVGDAVFGKGAGTMSFHNYLAKSFKDLQGYFFKTSISHFTDSALVTLSF